MSRMSFAQALKRLEELAKQDKLTRFEIGDVSLDQVSLLEPDPVRLKRMAEAAGLTEGMLTDRRVTAANIPPAWRTDGVSWSVYREIAKDPDQKVRVQLCEIVSRPHPSTESGRWTTSEILVLMGKKPITHTSSEPLASRLQHATPEEKIQAAEALLSDPTVAETAMNTGTRLGQRTYDLREEHDRRVNEAARRMAQDTERRDNADPLIQRANQMQAITDLTGVYSDAAAKATTLLRVIVALPRAGEDPLADRVFLTEAIDRLTATIEATQDLLAGRSQGVDAFFASVLKEARG